MRLEKEGGRERENTRERGLRGPGTEGGGVDI